MGFRCRFLVLALMLGIAACSENEQAPEETADSLTPDEAAALEEAPLDEAITISPGELKTERAMSLFGDAVAHHNKGENAEGAELLKQSLALRPNHPRTMSALAQLQSLAGDTDGAFETLGKISDLFLGKF